jgi:hypothetical protein
MSNLSEFIGPVIKSVQSGTTAIPFNPSGGSTTVDETITAIDTAKSFVCVRSFSSAFDTINKYFSVEILNSTTVRVTLLRSISDNDSGTISWTVVEYY